MDNHNYCVEYFCVLEFKKLKLNLNRVEIDLLYCYKSKEIRDIEDYDIEWIIDKSLIPTFGLLATNLLKLLF